MIRRIILYAIVFALVVIGYWFAFQPPKQEATPPADDVHVERGETGQ